LLLLLLRSRWRRISVVAERERAGLSEAMERRRRERCDHRQVNFDSCFHGFDICDSVMWRF
jgi:hypothetical protein